MTWDFGGIDQMPPFVSGEGRLLAHCPDAVASSS